MTAFSTTRPRSWRALRRPLAAAGLALALLLPVAVPAGADPVADKQAEAEEVADRLEALQRQVEVLSEQHHQASARLDDLERQVADAEASLARTADKEQEAQARLRDWAVRAYVLADADSGLTSILTSDGSDLGARLGYVDAALRRDRDVIDELRAAEEDAEVSRQALATAKDAADETRAQIEAQTAEAEAAVAETEQLLARVQGELAAAVAAEQARRDAEAAERARAEAQSRSSGTVPPLVQPDRSGSATSTAPAASGGAGSRAPAAPSSPAPSAPASGRAAAAVAAAQSQLGVPYRYAGSSPSSGFDCSGLVYWAYQQAGITIPRSSFTQWDGLTPISIDELQPGDLVFFYPDVHHVGMYVGDGQMIHAPHTGDVVRYASIWRDNLTGARRVTG